MYFLEFSCFFHDPADAGNLISGSSAFPKTSLNIWNFTVHVLLKPGLENFKHCFTSVWKWSRSVMSNSLRPMDYSLLGSSLHGIFQARVLEWIAISFSRASSRPRNRTPVSHIAGRRFTIWATREAFVKRREMKSKGEKERYKHLNAEFQRTARRDKKAFFSDQCKEIEENNKMGKTRDLFKKIRDIKGTFHAKMGTIKDRNGMEQQK